MEDLKERIEKIKEKLDLTKLKQEVREIQEQSSKPEFWQDQGQSALIMKKLANLQKQIDQIDQLEKLLAENKQIELEKKLANLETLTFLGGQYDNLGAILSIHAGQGGTEAMDWTAMLKRMYVRFLEKKDWDFDLIDETPGDEAGLKSTTLQVNVAYAYGYLRREAGTHRLVRQSPFNANNLRQTSFALVEVLPQIETLPEIQIKDEDLDWQFFRASSHGGQNVQKVSTAVRLIHKPTGIIVTAQTQRYQEQNRQAALNLLKAKLWQQLADSSHEEKQRLKAGRTMAAWGTQIRSYVLHPYKMVKDLRTDFQSGNPQAVLDGDLEPFIEAEIKTVL